jgi:hypothetical protein
MGRWNRQSAYFAGARPRCVSERSSQRRWTTTGDTRGLGAKGFALVLLLGATTHLFAACLLLNIRLIPFSPAAVYAVLIVIRNHRRNGSAPILDMVDVESRRIVDFKVVQWTNASGRGNYQRSGNGMEWKSKE